MRFLAIFCLLTSCTTTARQPASVAQDCRNPLEATDVPILLREHIAELLTPEEMKAKFAALLEKRYEYRAYREGEKLLAPLHRDTLSGRRSPNEIMELPQPFVDAVLVHMEEAFSRGYSVYPFFPDMGHGHFLLPVAELNALMERRASEKLSDGQVLEQIMRNRGLKILYHTAEQLKYLNGSVPIPSLNFLREHRNIVGSLSAPKEITFVQGGGSENTGGPPEGYATYGMFYVSAATRGCVPFSYDGMALFLDFSLSGPSYIPREVEEDR